MVPSADAFEGDDASHVRQPITERGPGARRIVSLLPSATETICALGLRDRLVGVTHECDWPPSVRDLPAVTRTRIPQGSSSAQIDALVRQHLRDHAALYTLDMDAQAALRPDLLVTQALCDVCAVAETEVAAAACGLPGQPRVVNLEPRTLGGVFDAIEAVGQPRASTPTRSSARSASACAP